MKHTRAKFTMETLGEHVGRRVDIAYILALAATCLTIQQHNRHEQRERQHVQPDGAVFELAANWVEFKQKNTRKGHSSN